MTTSTTRTISAAALCGTAVFSLATAQAKEWEFSGTLEAGDAQLESEEFFDLYPELKLEVGTLVTVELTSNAFDTYIIAQMPDEAGKLENDDNPDGEDGNSLLRFVVTEPGAWSILATSFEAGETGSYELKVSTAETEEVLTAEGALEDGDDVSIKGGELADVMPVNLEAGKYYFINVSSDQFDTHVSLHLSDGQVLLNDDGPGGSNSELAFVSPVSGPAKMVVSSFESGEMGDYDVSVYKADAPAGAEPPSAKDGGVKASGSFE